MMKTVNLLAIAMAFLMLHSTVFGQDLSPPSNVIASDGTFFAHVEITWDAVAEAELYRVFRCIDRRNTCGSPIAGPTGTSFNDSNGNPGQEYFYRVRACSTTACSRFSTAESGFRTMTLKEVTKLLSGVTRTMAGGNDTLKFSGMNVQIVNGEGSTTTANGAGNLIIGYNESRSEPENGICIDPTDPDPECDHREGSHNVSIGDKHNFTNWGGLVVGLRNDIRNEYASVSGGSGNLASGPLSSISGGFDNHASHIASSISGGSGNLASGVLASISGGSNNVADGAESSISGGSNNFAVGARSSISGGRQGITRGDSASVSGGEGNAATGDRASVSGGRFNNASGFGASVSGGNGNHPRGKESSISGGLNNQATGEFASISGGVGNVATGLRASISGGADKTAEGENCIVGDNGDDC